MNSLQRIFNLKEDLQDGKNHKRILLVGIAGGGDIISTLPTAFTIRLARAEKVEAWAICPPESILLHLLPGRMNRLHLLFVAR